MIYILAIISILIIVLISIYERKEIIRTTENYTIINSPMTKTELNFYKVIEKVVKENNFIIIPQVQLQKIFKIKNKRNISAFNKIKAKTIDFAILDKDFNYKIFIELDDYTHNSEKRMKRDYFVNELFKKNNLKLYRIKVSNNYNKEEIEKIIKEIV